MITLQEFCAYLDDLLQCKKYIDNCENGMQVEGKTQIKKLAIAVSASLAAIDKAVEWKADALLVHHGIFWNRDSYVIKGVKREKIRKLIDSGISLLAYHLPLDAHLLYGNNWKAAEEMGWSDLEPFGIFNGLPIGVKGKLPLQSRNDFKKMLESYYRHPAHCALGGSEDITTAALISGGAHRSILEAINAGVDCFVTGSFDEPIWHYAFEEGINFFALGHSATEEIGPKALGSHLEEKFKLETCFIDVPNPF